MFGITFELHAQRRQIIVAELVAELEEGGGVLLVARRRSHSRAEVGKRTHHGRQQRLTRFAARTRARTAGRLVEAKVRVADHAEHAQNLGDPRGDLAQQHGLAVFVLLHVLVGAGDERQQRVEGRARVEVVFERQVHGLFGRQQRAVQRRLLLAPVLARRLCLCPCKVRKKDKLVFVLVLFWWFAFFSLLLLYFLLYFLFSFIVVVIKIGANTCSPLMIERTLLKKLKKVFSLVTASFSESTKGVIKKY